MSDWFQKRRIGDLPNDAASRWSEREALVFNSSTWTFAEFAKRVDEVAKGLIALGVEPTDRVAIWVSNRPEWLFAFFAATRIGAIAVPMNTRLRIDDAAHVLRASGASALIIRETVGVIDFVELAQSALHQARGSGAETARGAADAFSCILVVDGDQRDGGFESWDGLVSQGREVPDEVLESRAAAVDPDSPAFILFTSGSTGLPKGVVHSHCLIRNVIDEANRLGIGPEDTVLMYLPLFHTLGLYEGPMTMVLAGARMVLQERFLADTALGLIERHRCTLIHGFDTHFGDILSSPELARRDTSSLRTGILAAGMASTEPVAREAQDRLMSAVSGWGMTEVGCGALLGKLSDSIDARCLSSGSPLPGYEFRIVDPISGKPVAQGESGELCVRSYQMFLGYYGDREATEAAFDRDGWFRTGDQAIESSNGSIRFLGRYKDILKVGGENVDPAEIEALLRRDPRVLDAQVVGRVDARMGEVPVACIIMNAGEVPLALDDVQAMCGGRVASFKVPRDVVLMDEFPTTSSGKVQKFVLRDRVALDR